MKASVMYLQMQRETLVKASITRSHNDESHIERKRKIYRYERVRECKERISPAMRMDGIWERAGGDDEYGSNKVNTNRMIDNEGVAPML